MKRILNTVPPADTPDTLSARDAALVLGVHERTVRRAIARGELPAVKRGGAFQITRDDLRRFRIPSQLLTPSFPRRPELPRLLPAPGRDERTEPALPKPRTPLIGRSDDVAQVTRQFEFEGKRHVTLTGAGGVGKTRVSIQVANELIPAYPGGVWFVAFASVRDPSLLGPTIARAMGIVEQTDRPIVEILSSVIRNRRMLLTLDNLEHLLAETGLIAELLEACPNLAILATSRTRLNVSGEHEHHIVPLTVPHQLPNTAQRSWVETAAEATAVQLFVDRAQAVVSTFELTAENAGAIAAIVAAVDGLPLAIELVAAQTRLFSPADLLKRMGRPLPLLTGGPRDRPKRHQTMADAIAWSYDLLSADEQVLFRRLSAFVGGCTLEAAEAVADLGETPPILGMISSLVDHQLLLMIGRPGNATRFTMLETIREFAGERLTESGDRPACHRRHASFFLGLAEQYQLGEVLPDGETAVTILDTEQANLRAALVWLDASSDAEPFLQLAVALGIYWSGQGMYQEGQYWLERALAHPAATLLPDRAKALTRLGMIELYQGINQPAESHLTEALALSQTSGGDFNIAHALLGLGAAAIQRGDKERGTALLEECRTAAELLADRRLGEIMTGWVLGNLAVVSRAQGDLAQATVYLEDGLERMRRASYIRGMTFILADLGDVMLDQGKHARALSLYREALSLAQANPGTRTVVQLIESVAMVAAAAMRFELCARLLGAADALRERIGLGYRVAESEAAVARALATARARLGVEAFSTVWAEGRSLPPGEAVAEARDPAVIPASTTLTRRETEILRLISAGMTDSAIAETLFIGVRTVQNHVAHIFAKLGVRTRAAAAQATGLMPPKPRARD